MKRLTGHMLGIAVAGVLLSNPVVADKPPWAGAGKGKGRDAQVQPMQGGGYFIDRGPGPVVAGNAHAGCGAPCCFTGRAFALAGSFRVKVHAAR